jgi:hypothetical protein
MVDPVQGSDGRTYERSAITEWLRTHTTSPITREPMTAASLTPNYALRSMIERHNTTVVPKAKKSAKIAKSTITTNSVSEDHQYAIRVQQEEIAAYTPLSAAPANQQIQQTQQNAEKQKKILTAFCLIGIFIVILVIIIKIT